MAEMLDVAFQAGLDRLKRQEAALDNIRARVGTIVAISALAASFLGAAFVRDQDMGLAFWIGAAFFLGVIGMGLAILLPAGEWLFSPAIRDLLEHYLEGDPEDAKKQLATKMATWIDENQTKLNSMYDRLAMSIGWLGVALLAWFLELAI